MFKSLYTFNKIQDRKYDEAVLTAQGALVTLFILLIYHFVLSTPISYLLLWCNSYFGTSFGSAALNLIIQLITVALLVFFFHGFYKQSLKAFFKEFKAIYIWFPIVCYVLAYFASMVVQLILILIRGSAQSTSNNDAVSEMLVETPFSIILVTVVLAPLVEETIFRAGFCRSMTVSKNKFVKALGFIISISVFSLMHVYQYAFFATDASGALYLTFNADEFLSILVYLPMSAALAACSYFCKNFWVSVIYHMGTNAISVGLMLLLSLY